MATGPAMSPLSKEYLLIKWIVVSPGDALELFQVSDVFRHFDANSYEAMSLIIEDIPDVQFSEKDTQTFGFLFDYTDEIHFKCFSDCKYIDGGSSGFYLNTYQVRYLALKLLNQWVKETLCEKCYFNGYGYRVLDAMPW